jgi:hypothetical protein
MGNLFQNVEKAFRWIFSVRHDDPADMGAIKAVLRSGITFIVIAVMYWFVGHVIEWLIPPPSLANTVVKTLEAVAFFAALFVFFVRMVYETGAALRHRRNLFTTI